MDSALGLGLCCDKPIPSLPSDASRPSRSCLDLLTPELSKWFRSELGTPTDAQEKCVPDIVARESVLLTAPTGSGKTLAGFLGVIDSLIRRHHDGKLNNRIYAIYISPLRALTYDIERNLRPPIDGSGHSETIRVGVRTGDTTANERAKMKRRPPHILLTTPESLAIMLPQKGFRDGLAGCEFVIVDELHALAANKRGTHLAVSLERLESLADCAQITRVGLSATIAPLGRIADFLGGSAPGRKPVHIREGKDQRRSRIEVMSPIRKDPYPPAGYTAVRVIQDIAAVVERNRTTIIFCNTRSGAENISTRLKAHLPKLADQIGTHHSSLDRDLRHETELRLKDGELRAIVCSTSLELGIDVGTIDTVVMISTPKGINRTLQRVGRSGHSVHQSSHGVLVATNINDLVECAVCSRMAKEGQLDEIEIFDGAHDVAIQHLMGLAMEDGGTTRKAALETLRSSYPFRAITEITVNRLIDYLMGGGRSLEDQYRQTFGKIVEHPDGVLTSTGRKAERDYLVNVGTIHSQGMVRVYLGKRKLGEVEESFMKGLNLGDVFVLGGKIVQLEETGVAEARVSLAKGRMPTVPTWNANKMPLSSGLGRGVAAIRGQIDAVLDKQNPEAAQEFVVEHLHVSAKNAQAIVGHFSNQRLISSVPTDRRLLIEIYREVGTRKDETESELWHVFFHTLIGRNANNALSRIISWRLSQLVGGNAMVTIDDYGFLLTLQPFQMLEDLNDWRALFVAENAEQHLETALDGSELVKWQFRGIAQTGLMVPRNLPGRERQLKQLRWSSEILFQVLEQHEPDHPLLVQAQEEAKYIFLDLPGALHFLETCQDGLDWDIRKVPAVSPFAFGIYASKIKEGMMLEDIDTAIERLYAAFETASQDSSVRAVDSGLE